MSSDKTGMYYYSLDSLTKLIKDQKKIERLILRADWSIINNFPDEINGLTIQKQNTNKQIKKKDLGPTDVIVNINGLSIIRYEVRLSMYTFEKQGNDLSVFADGVYIFYFKYIPETETYILRDLKRGMIL